MTDFTAILNVHNEGVLAHRAIKSLLACVAVAKSRGYSGEILAVADNAEEATRDVVLSFQGEFDLSVVWGGDLGAARNHGVKAAFGEVVFFFDGDDVWGDEWIARAMDELKQHPDVVVHPQLIMNFGSDKLYWQHTDCRDPKFDPSTFLITNHWTANCGARRKLFLDHPYRRASAEEGFGFEDWEWNARTWAAGIPHVVVPKTVHFIRKADNSMSKAHAAQGRTIRPGGIFNKPFYAKKVSDKIGDVQIVNRGPQTSKLNALGPAPKLEIGEWAHEQALRAHAIEPEFWADPRDYLERSLYTVPTLPQGWQAYWELRELVLENKPTHIIFGAGIGGGADMRVEFYATQAKLAGKVPLVVWTNGPGRNVAGVTCVAGDPVRKSIGDAVFSHILLRNMIELDSGTIVHIVNSAPVYQAIAVGARAVKAAGVRVFASMYAIEKNRDGQRGGYAVNGGLTAIRNVAEQVITDCRSFVDELREQTGWASTTFVPTLAVPSTFPDAMLRENGEPRILWCGRLEWAKDPALLASIAALLPSWSFTVIASAGDEYGKAALSSLVKLQNVRVLPPYTGQLPLEMTQSHDALLVTSRHEGMPHLVLEALRLGLPIIGTSVGGLRELAGSGFVETVTDESQKDPAAWVLAFQRIEERGRAARRAADYLSEEHSQEAVTRALVGIDYV